MKIIPWPKTVELNSGFFPLTAETIIIVDTENEGNGRILHELLAAPTGFPFSIHPTGTHRNNAIYLAIDSNCRDLGSEGYRLHISPDRIDIGASEIAGVFYGIQTMRQLLPSQVESKTAVSGLSWKIPCVNIEDEPRFSWRGFMLDEGRHFQGKQTVLRLLDVMALLKLNRFHWHLTEDQGWRLEIKAYPLLTEIGSHRPGTGAGQIDRIRGLHDGIPHGGFYTQEEVREIVAYAADRHITIMPEIEMPGHSTAAVAAYPELGCTGRAVSVTPHFGVFKDVYCLGKQSTITFLKNVLEEVMAIFPGPYIHIGGDEAPRDHWKKCPDCLRRIAEEGFQDEHALQVDLTNQMARYLAGNRRILVGWNEITDEGLHPSAILHYWMGDRDQVVQAIKNGRSAIISSYRYYYLDHTYRFMPLSKTYNHEPVFSELTSTEAGNVLGVETPLWTEHIPNRDRLGYQAFPRLPAMAETAWTPAGQKELAFFKHRVSRFQDRMQIISLNYAPLPDSEPSKISRFFGPLTIVRL